MAGPWEQEIWINGYRWKRVSGTYAGIGYPAGHVYACGGDPRVCQSIASTAFWESELTTPRKKWEPPKTEDGKRLKSVLIRQFGYKPETVKEG